MVILIRKEGQAEFICVEQHVLQTRILTIGMANLLCRSSGTVRALRSTLAFNNIPTPASRGLATGTTTAKLPLDGIRVLDLTRVLAGVSLLYLVSAFGSESG